MGYIQSENHFLNIIHKTIKISVLLDREELLDDDSYVKLIYSEGLADKFTWDLREFPQILEYEGLSIWLKKGISGLLKRFQLNDNVYKGNYVYFIQAPNGLVKIGKSNNPKQRLKNLQHMSPVRLEMKRTIRGGLYLEHALHKYFKHLRKHGEWFKPDYELKQFINGKRKILMSSVMGHSNLMTKKRMYL